MENSKELCGIEMVYEVRNSDFKVLTTHFGNKPFRFENIALARQYAREKLESNPSQYNKDYSPVYYITTIDGIIYGVVLCDVSRRIGEVAGHRGLGYCYLPYGASIARKLNKDGSISLFTDRREMRYATELMKKYA